MNIKPKVQGGFNNSLKLLKTSQPTLDVYLQKKKRT
jgi:hypothetical protein